MYSKQLISLLGFLAVVSTALDLVRVDPTTFEEVPADLGENELFVCTGEGSERSCKFSSDAMTKYIAVSDQLSPCCKHVP